MSSDGRRILLAIDPSENSKFAFEWMVKNIWKENDEVVVCHIPEPPRLPAFSFKDGFNLPASEWQKSLQEQMEKTNKLHSDYEAELISRKMKYHVVGEHHKNAGEGIIKCAKQEKADMIVIGTRGLDAIRRTILGSVSDYVIHHSHIPTVVCPKM